MSVNVVIDGHYISSKSLFMFSLAKNYETALPREQIDRNFKNLKRQLLIVNRLQIAINDIIKAINFNVTHF